MALRSTDIMKIAGLAAAGCAVAPCGGFVPMLRTSSQSSSSTSHAAGRTAQQNGSAHAASWLPVAGLAGSAAVAQAAARRSRQSKIRVASSGAATIAPEEEPAPPPPFDPAKQLGVTQPLGFFDPLGFSKVGDEEGFRNLRVAEMKHGRVAMMAAVGALSQAFFQLPGFEAVPKGLGAVTSAPGTYGFAVLFLVSGALELLLWKEDPSKGVDSIGDYGNPLQLGVGQPLGESEEMRNRELNNGRAAMFAAIGIIVAELVSGKNALEQLVG